MRTIHCDIPNPLVRDGTSQRQRLLKALDPDYFAIDDRSVADLLCFARRYARELQYYDPNNRPDGHWGCFFENDISAIIAEVGCRDLREWKACREGARQVLIAPAAADALTDIARRKQALYRYFSAIYTLAVQMDRWLANAATGLRFQQELHRLVTADLRQPLRALLGYFRCAQNHGYLDATPLPDLPCAEPLLPAEALLQHRFRAEWIAGDPVPGWDAYRDSIPEDCALFAGHGAADAAAYAAAATALQPLADAFLSAHQQLQNTAPDLLAETLEKWPAHEPHVALFLTFLKLFSHAQTALNELTGRHLDFYYREVLQLRPRAAVPDRVHLVFELAKHVDAFLLKKGVRFKAGKDATGKEVHYELGKDTPLNRAAVAELKTVFVDKAQKYRVYAAPVANSQDGLGAPLTGDEPKWKTLGAPDFDEEGRPVGPPPIPPAEIGFAIASPLLWLAEGKRTIELMLFSGTTSLQLTATALRCQLSGEKGWLEVPAISISKGHTLRIRLDAAHPPVTGYRPEVHGGSYPTSDPLLKITLKTPPEAMAAYETLRNRTINKIRLQVQVEGVRQLLVQNDLGVMDPGKPFLPFGPQPTVGSRFYLGSAEIFRKRLTRLKLNLEWKDAPQDLGAHYANYGETVSSKSFRTNVQLLQNGEWLDLSPNHTLFTSPDARTLRQMTIPADAFENPEYQPGPIEMPLSGYQVGTKSGFVRLVLTAPGMAFGHKIFPAKYAQAIVKYASNPTDANAALIPKEPYTPEIAAISADYVAADSLIFGTAAAAIPAPLQFFHQYPFGFQPVSPGVGRAYLFPQFRLPGAALPAAGALFIGITGLRPPQNLSLLFQMAEGTANPLRAQQPVQWHYLSGDTWKPFENGAPLSDSTNGLLTSGIVRLKIPADATTAHTLLPPGLHWIRAAVQDHADAVCDAIAVHAQAGTAEFRDRKNDPAFLAQRLPAGTISKPVESIAALKKVAQPYASLGGRVAEPDRDFYQRVSERLRHKDRGVTIWDYERLVLGAFPGIYKVKCINHSTYQRVEGEVEIPAAEFAPGYVTVVVIPDVRGVSAVNRLQPRASLNTLSEIKALLTRRMSPFAAQRLEVLNPLYEKIRLRFEVEFCPDCDRGIYVDILQTDLQRFLSPWAFDEGADIAFGGKIHRSVLLNFVEERPYVDFVGNFRMDQIIPGSPTATIRSDVETALPGSARSIFVSDAAHQINQISEAKCKTSSS